MEEIISQEELDREAVKFASEHCQRDENGKPVDYQSLYYGFKEGINFVMKYRLNYKCYHCGKTTSDVVFAYMKDEDGSATRIAICQECYEKLIEG